MRATIFVLSAIILISCGGGDGDGHHCDSSVCINTANDPTVNPVWYFNAHSYSSGYTIRWPDGPVSVEVLDSRVAIGNLQSTLSEINSLIAPANLVLVSNAGGTAKITIRYDPSRPRNYGYTTWYFAFYQFYRVDIDMGDFDDAGYTLHNVFKHEMLHAVGIFVHTNNGSVMDPIVYNGIIPDIIRQALTGLYALPPGTYVYP